MPSSSRDQAPSAAGPSRWLAHHPLTAPAQPRRGPPQAPPPADAPPAATQARAPSRLRVSPALHLAILQQLAADDRLSPRTVPAVPNSRPSSACAATHSAAAPHANRRSGRHHPIALRLEHGVRPALPGSSPPPTALRAGSPPAQVPAPPVADTLAPVRAASASDQSPDTASLPPRAARQRHPQSEQPPAHAVTSTRL